MSGVEVERTLAVLLDEVEKFVRRYVAMDANQAAAVALWVVHTHMFAAAEVSPYLAILSAEKRSGKSTLLRVLEVVCARPWRVVSPTEAVVYRKIERDSPTLLLDECDTIFGKGRDQEPLRALLNAGNESGVVVPRCGGANRDRLDEFSTFCPKALAGIGKAVPDTVRDRAITLTLKRRARSETVIRLRRREAAASAAELQSGLSEIADLATTALTDARPAIPEELDDRAADGWEPLLAIADLASGDWPQRARRAALALSSQDARDDDSPRVQLLADIRRVFSGSRMFTADIVEALASDTESPWVEWRDHPTAGRRLGAGLRPFGIRSGSVRIGSRTGKGYKREDLEDAWDRYLPPVPSQRSQPAYHAGTPAVDDGSHRSGVTDARIAANLGVEPHVSHVTASNATGGSDADD